MRLGGHNAVNAHEAGAKPVEQVPEGGAGGPTSPAPSGSTRAKDREKDKASSVWVRCEACGKWRRALAALLPDEPSAWRCSMSEDRASRSCEAAQDVEAAFLLPDGGADAAGADVARTKAGRELRPLRPPKQTEEVPRDMLRARLPGPGARNRERKEDKEGRARSPRTPGENSNGKRYLSASGPASLGLGRASTRIAVHEEGVWRFQPAVGAEFQIEVDAAPSTLTPEVCRTRQDVCVWLPDRAKTEGIDVASYMEACERLNAAAPGGISYGPECVLRALHLYEYDSYTAIPALASLLGAEKTVDREAPVVATTSLVRGRHGIRVGLSLCPRHLATSLCYGQPQSGSSRSTRSRQVAMDPPVVKVEWTQEDELAFAAGLRKHGADLQSIQRRILRRYTMPQVVEFYYSAKGQAIEVQVEEERAAAERLKENRQAAAAEAAERERLAAGVSGSSSGAAADGKPKKSARAGEADGFKRPRASAGIADGNGKLQRRVRWNPTGAPCVSWNQT